MTTIGLIGSGGIGSTVARLAVAAGHHEQVLCALVAELTGVPGAGVDDDILRLGADSVMATRLVSMARLQGRPDHPEAGPAWPYRAPVHPGIRTTGAWRQFPSNIEQARWLITWRASAEDDDPW
jgi:hypothetical protein